MKKGVVILGSLILALAFCLPAVAQPSAKAVETIVIDSFDTPDSMDWTWDVQASRFVTKGYPVAKTFEGIPLPLKPYHDANTPAQVLGVKVAFDRKGDNWFEVYPKDKDGNAYEIPFRGTVSQIDFWVWGANYNYNLELLVRDANGVVRKIDAGNMGFEGWRNIVLNVPGWIPQHSRFRNGRKVLTFVGFRVRSAPTEAVDNFVIYFDQLKFTSNTVAGIYDGYELSEADFGESSN
jgi:hypothetical protein